MFNRRRSFVLEPVGTLTASRQRGCEAARWSCPGGSRAMLRGGDTARASPVEVAPHLGASARSEPMRCYRRRRPCRHPR